MGTDSPVAAGAMLVEGGRGMETWDRVGLSSSKGRPRGVWATRNANKNKNVPRRAAAAVLGGSGRGMCGMRGCQAFRGK